MAEKQPKLTGTHWRKIFAIADKLHTPEQIRAHLRKTDELLRLTIKRQQKFALMRHMAMTDLLKQKLGELQEREQQERERKG